MDGGWMNKYANHKKAAVVAHSQAAHTVCPARMKASVSSSIFVAYTLEAGRRITFDIWGWLEQCGGVPADGFSTPLPLHRASVFDVVAARSE